MSPAPDATYAVMLCHFDGLVVSFFVRAHFHILAGRSWIIYTGINFLLIYREVIVKLYRISFSQQYKGESITYSQCAFLYYFI